MENKLALPAEVAISSENILEMAKSHCKPRVRLSDVIKEKAENTQQPSPQPVSDVQYNAKKLIMLVIAAPFLPTSGYYDLLGLNYREGNEAKTEATGKELLIEHRFHSGKQGGQAILLEPSRTACGMFKLPFPYENPGFLHRYLQHQVKVTMMARGYKAILEKNVNGKNIDVVLEKGKEMVAVEIAVTDKHEVVNVRKDIFQAGFDRVVIIGRDRKVISSVEKKITAAFDSDITSKVQCCVLADLLDGK